MKNKVLMVFLALICLMPFKAFAKEYNATNLDEALKEVGIEHDFSDYKETEDQAIVYVFWSKGCPHCRKLLTFLSSIIPDYGDKFKVVSYETSRDRNNAKLLDEVRTFMGNDGTGVPFAVIGEDFFYGYSEDYNDAIIDAIERQYASDERYDVLEELEKSKAEATRKVKAADVIIILFNLLFTSLATGTIIIYINVKNKKLLEAINSNKKGK